MAGQHAPGTLLRTYTPLMCIGIGVQILLIVTLGHAQQTQPSPESGTDLGTNLNTDGAGPTTQIPVTVTSISTLIVTELSSTILPAESSTTQSKTNASSETTTTSNSTSLPQANLTSRFPSSTQSPVINATTSLLDNTTNLSDIGTNPTTDISTSIAEEVSTLGNESTSPTSTSNSSMSEVNMETDLITTIVTSIGLGDDVTDGMMMTTAENLITYKPIQEETGPMYVELTTPAGKGEGILTESLIRLMIIAGATAGSCLVLLIVFFLIGFYCHKKRQKKKRSRYYEFKKKDYRAKYEKVEQQNSLARREQPQNTPIGGGWVFNSAGYHGDYDEETPNNVQLRSISPLAVATPLLKIHPADDQNGVPDSGHGGSIAPDDSALGFSPSLEEEIESELNPLHRALGTSVGSGSELRDQSTICGDSDTISVGNEAALDKPIRDVHFNSFGANGRVASEEAVEL